MRLRWYTAKIGKGTEFAESSEVTENDTVYANWTVTDIDGNVYHAVTIGTQTWMVENLKTTRLNDGTAIPNVTDNTAWSNLTTPGFCWYDNNETAYKGTYGALYNWYIVKTSNLAPAGWHVPDTIEWNTLQDYLIANRYNYDGTTTENKIAKSLASTTNWNTSPTAGTPGNDLLNNNRSGFSALPSGFRGNVFGYVGDDSYWWSATENSVPDAWNRDLHFRNENLGHTLNAKMFGFSVRCIQGNQYSVNFDSQGGSAVTTQMVVEGERATEPIPTIRTGHTFAGWFKEATCVNEWVFSTGTVTGNVTLYAKWEIKQYMVTFNSQGGSDVPALNGVAHGSTIPKPDPDPSRTGYTFGGWFEDDVGTNPWDFGSETVVGDDTLYVKWDSYTYTVTFDDQGATTRVNPTSKTVSSPSTTINVLPVPPTKMCYIFSGWYTAENGGGVEFTVSSIVTTDTKVYAKWEFKDTIYVDSAAKGTNSGRSWGDAFTDLRTAIDSACGGSEILVAKGTYFPHATSRDSSFVLKNGVKLYGGFPKGGGTRNIEAYPTILSGEIQGDGDSANNSYTVVKAVNVNSSCVMDGMTITGGYGGSNGGGINISNGSPTLSYCTFNNNSCSYNSSGGGAYISNGSPTLSYCTFNNNSSSDGMGDGAGGGVSIDMGSSPTLSNCTFNSNYSSFAGGGASISISSPTFLNCTFSNNSSFVSAGVSLSGDSTDSSIFSRCVFLGNSGTECGGGLGSCVSGNSTLTLSECTFTANQGGGICCRGYNGSISSCLFADNKASVGGGIYFIGNHDIKVTNCTFYRNSASLGGACYVEFLSNPIYTNCTFTANSATGSGGAICDSGDATDTVKSTLTNCLLWGNSAPLNPELHGGIYSFTKIKNCVIQNGYSGPGTTDSLFTFDPLLGTLGDNGGPVQTIPIPSNSPARDKGTVAVPAGVDISKDARGFPRSDGKPDIGAYEVQ